MDDEVDQHIQIDLHSACNLGDVDLVEKILERGNIDVNARNEGGWTPLMYACWGGHERLVELLLSCGARKDESNRANQPPIIVAVKSGSLNIVKLVYQKDLLGHVDIYGKCALFYAVDFGYCDISAFLLAEGADANFSLKGITVLIVAATNGHRDMVELLLQHGADVHARNKQGFTAQQLAIAHQHLDIADMLDPSYHVLPDLESFLKSLNLYQYWPIFQEKKIDFKRFLQLDEAGLKALGVKLLGPRRKMSLAIASFRRPIRD